MNIEKNSDFLIIGGGVIGLSIARKLKNIYPDATITLIEKEAHCGLHASGRNSGVLHAGFYYTKDSLKAKFTRVGNERLTAYCDEKKIPINKCGKLVVAKNADELNGLDELLKRAKDNNVLLHSVTAQEAKEIEPRAITFERALFSPTTSSVNPKDVLLALQQDAQNEGIYIHTNVKYIEKVNSQTIKTNQGNYHANYIINAAGLYADKIAKDFDFSKDYRILPFKGLYLYSNEPAHAFRTNIYPVPDLKNPFLGVHFTVTVDGKAKIGPTAIPALWREQYQAVSGFKLTELVDIIARQMNLLLFANFDFKKLALDEVKKYSKSHLVNLSKSLANNIKLENYKKFGPPGIRAQLLNTKTKKLEMDFVLEGDKHSFHILNAVSPAFTSSFPFADFVCEKITALIR